MAVGNEKFLRGRVAVVTGAGHGIGRAHALCLAKAGASLVVNDIGCDTRGNGADQSPATLVVAEIAKFGGVAIANTDSVAIMEGAHNIIAAAVDTFGRIDILVNSAGVIRPNLIFDASEEEFDLTFGVHVKGTFATSHFAASHFRAQHSGIIINFGSDSGLGNYGNSLYAAAKEAIAGFTRSIARELGPYNARCNMIRPWASTRMGEEPKVYSFIQECEQKHGFPAVGDLWLTTSGPGQGQSTSSPAERVQRLSPEHIAGFSAWLCTDKAAHVNGETFRVKEGEVSLMSDPQVVRSAFQKEAWGAATLSDSAVTGFLFKDMRNRFISQSKAKVT